MSCSATSVGLVDHLEPALLARVHQVAGQLGLAVDHDLLAGQLGDVDADQPLAVGEVEAVVRQALGLEPRIEPEPLHQRDGDLLEHAGADAAEHVIGRLPLEHHALDALGAQQVAEQQPGGPGADDADLGLHAAA